MERKLIRIGRGKILHGPRQGQNLQMCSGCSRAVFVGHAPLLIRHQQNFGAKKRSFLVQFYYFKTVAALSNQIHAAVGIFLRDRDGLRRASDIGNPFLERAHHAKWRVVGQTLADHLLVAWLEDVQGQRCARKQNNIEREQRKEGQAFSSE